MHAGAPALSCGAAFLPLPGRSSCGRSSPAVPGLGGAGSGNLGREVWGQPGPLHIFNPGAAWLNNCVGHYNHRYFFSFCLFMTMGCIYCGISSWDMFREAYAAIEVTGPLGLWEGAQLSQPRAFVAALPRPLSCAHHPLAGLAGAGAKPAGRPVPLPLDWQQLRLSC